MSLFKTKRKTQVYTSISRAVDDASIVPSNKMAILNYVMSSDSSTNNVNASSIADYMISATVNNSVARAKKGYNYSKKAGYAYGAAKTDIVSQFNVDIKGAVADELERLYPQGVVVHNAYFGPMNNYYFLKPILWQKYGYNYDTNELVDESARIGFPCYMESAVIKYSKYSTDAQVDPDTLNQYGLSAEAGYTPFRPANPKAPHVPWVTDYEGDHDIAVVTVVYKDAAGAKKTYDLTVDFLAYESSSKPIDEGLDDSDTNNIQPDAITESVEPTLDGQDYYQANYTYTENGVSKEGIFIYLYGSGLNQRLDNLFNVTDSYGQFIPRVYARMNGMKCNDESLEDTDKYKAMVGLGRKLGMNWSNWVDEVHKSVGSVGDVSQILMTHAVPANTEDPLVQEYLYEYFLDLYGRIPQKFANSNFSDLKLEMLSYGSKEGQSIVIKDEEYTQTVAFTSIGFMDIQGSIGKVGTVASGMRKEYVFSGRPGSVFRPMSSIVHHFYRKQVSPNVYREVRVYGLACSEHVIGGYNTTASGDSANLMIPIDISLNHEFNNKQLEELYTKSMHIIINTVKVIKKKWYQTGIFQAIMIVIAIIISVVTVGAGAPLSAYIVAAAVAVAQAIAIGLVLQLAVKLLVNMGVDVGIVAAVAAVVAAVFGAYGAIKDVAMAGVTAAQLLTIATQAFSMSAQGFALQLKETIKQYTSLFAELSAEQKALKQKYEELGVAGDSTLLMFEPPLNIGVRIGEPVEDYYSRSVHVSNVGTAIYYILENNVSESLTLPTRETILNRIKERTDELSVPEL